MQINRLFEMLHMMLNKKNITAKELAEYFEVSVRTVYRDVETLASAGIPVYSLRGKNGGIGLLESYTLNKSLISQDEQNEIMYALQSLKAANYPETEETLKKLSLIFNKSSDNWIEIDFSRYGSDDNVLFENIKQAILKKLTIKFISFTLDFLSLISKFSSDFSKCSSVRISSFILFILNCLIFFLS